MRTFLSWTGIWILLLVPFTLHGQNPGYGNLLERGEMLYNSGRYAEAYREFSEIKDRRERDRKGESLELDYWIAVCADEAGRSDADDLLESFLNRYPGSVYTSRVQFRLGNRAFEEKDFGRAADRYYAVDPKGFDRNEQDEFHFKMGYALFAQERYDKAYPYLVQVDYRSPYYSHAQYCMGYADYRKGAYESAAKFFSSIADDDTYKRVVPFYLLQIEFSRGNYPYVVENGDRILASAVGHRAQEIMRMMGVSWFHRADWEEAARYVAMYEKAGGQMGREENYMCGFSNYMLGNYADAERYLSKTCGPDDRLSQNASYHLADCYLQLGDKNRAMQSFSIASVAGYDETISEDALYNYGKLQYELGGGYFNEAINVLNRYLSLYPTSPHVAQVREYLIAAYYNSRNFDAAYRAITAMPNPDNNVKAALQKITYFRALECYNEGDLETAYSMLDQSLRHRFNAKYTALAGFWQGEILYRQGRFSEACRKYENYIKLSPQSEAENLIARYNTAYGWFNQQNMEKAREWFDDFLARYDEEDSFRADALNRRGDIEYAERSFWSAIGYYDRAAAIGTDERHYSAWQRAMMLGMVDRVDRKIESLEKIIATDGTEYAEAAMYELGRTYIAQEKFSQGAKTLQTFVADYPSSPRRYAALADLGLIYQNLNDNDRALQYYKMIVEEQPYSDAARGAMSVIRSIYVNKNDVNGYFAYAREIGYETDMSGRQRDSLAYAAAQRIYLSGDASRAVEALDRYVEEYPKGSYLPAALYYSGEASMAVGERRTAYERFDQLSRLSGNDYSMRGYRHLATLAMELGEWARASEAYEWIALRSEDAASRAEAREGQLKAVVQIGDLSSIVEVADTILTEGESDELIRSAKFAKAKASAGMGETGKALELYRELAGNVQTVEGAEAAYRVIEADYVAGRYDDAEKAVYAFADQNPPSSYWLGKAFLTLGDIYARMGDAFQARATYQSIVDGYVPVDDGIVDEAKRKISELK